MAYNSPTTAMDHQKRALRAAAKKPKKPTDKDVFAYFMDMGTGKSKVVLDEWGEAAASGGTPDLLISAPSGSYRNWFEDKSKETISELRKHLDPELYERALIVGWSSGGGKGMRRAIEHLLSMKDKKRPRVLVVNTEALSMVDRCVEACMEFVKQRGAYVAQDESTMLRGDSNRTTNMIGIGNEAVTKRILSGLPTPKGPFDLYRQFEFLDPRIIGIDSMFAFKMRYASMRKVKLPGRKRPFWQVLDYRNIDELQKKIAPYSFRVLKSECLDLEPKIYTSRDVELTDEQRRIYSDLKHFATAEISEGKFVTVERAVTRMMRLHQVNCGHVVDEEGQVHPVKENRTAMLLEVLGEHRGKAIIWTHFTEPLERIKQAIEKEFGEGSVALFWGGNKGTRSDDERRFLEDPKCKYMLATQGAGMRGNTWVVADLVVYYSNNFDLEQRDQSEDRAHRKGQVNRVTYVDLIARGTIDEKIVHALRNKIDIATMITGEGYREWLV